MPFSFRKLFCCSGGGDEDVVPSKGKGSKNVQHRSCTPSCSYKLTEEYLYQKSFLDTIEQYNQIDPRLDDGWFDYNYDGRCKLTLIEFYIENLREDDWAVFTALQQRPESPGPNKYIVWNHNRICPASGDSRPQSATSRKSMAAYIRNKLGKYFPRRRNRVVPI